MRIHGDIIKGAKIMSAALIIGFLSAIGWWGGNKVTAAIDGVPAACSITREVGVYEYIGEVTNVVDGDTVDVTVDLGFKVTTAQRLRLAGVDTPERNQAGFSEAKEFTQEMIGGKFVTIKTQKVSKYGYYLADITIDGKNVSQELIAAGLGKPYDGGKK